ncbi:uncharacterized protein EV422DRAFT_396404 [Fimicolochytrium jonesii]|uniref:uncharacterized protein n=1 Tax=Fimicolochytrium jonesii TaxID=1396493 RepID=UPI0022FF044C|nr:uncharacterized protein EV422DRAFT_396404 [Fimicolochytrium jonesii]KAI8822382.1 hypothetical protein EV422DRAFT_396404 [Fimicolochytrium jonesii]
MLARGQGGEDVVPSSDPLDNESVDKETFVDPDSGHDAHQPLDSQVPQDLDFASLRQQHDMALMAQDPLFSSRSVTGANTNHLVLGRHPMSNGPALDISRDSLDSAAMLGAENIKLESIDTPIPAPDKRSNNASVPFGSTTSIADSTALPFPSPIRLDLAPRPYAPQHAYMPDFPPGPAPHHHMIIDTRQHHMVVLEKNEIEKQLMAAKGCIDDLFQEYVRLERENRFLRDGAGYTSSQEQQQAYLGNGSQRLLPRRIPHHHVPHDGINNSIPFPRSSTSGEPAQDPLSSRVEFHQQRLLVPQHQQLQPQQQQQQQQQQQSSEFDNTALHSFGTHGFDSNAETVSLKALAMHAADTAKSAGRGSPPQEDTIAGSLRASIATLSAPAGGNGIHGIPASTPMDSHASQWRYHPQMYAITNAVSIGTSSSSATTATTTLPPATTTTEDSSLPPSTAPQQQEQQDIYTENERLKRELAHVRELLKRRNVEYMRLDAVHKSCGVLQGLLAMCE